MQRAAYAVVRCLSVRLYRSFIVYSIETSKRIINLLQDLLAAPL